MEEVIKNQESVTESLRSENEKYNELEATYKLERMISQAREYHEKLANIKRSMLIMKDKTVRLKRKATKILEDKNREDLELQRSRERREMLERHLEPVVNTRRD